MPTHVNKAPFLGVLTLLDTPSDKPPSGARGHKVILTKQAAYDALDSLIGMGVNMASDGISHVAYAKIGVIESAEIRGCEILITGYLYRKDVPAIIERLAASADYGLSYELDNARVEDMRQEVWTLTRVTFTGAAIIRKDKAAYHLTDFVLL